MWYSYFFLQYCVALDGAKAVGDSFYGYSLAGIVLENVACEGSESSLFGCSGPPLGRVLSSECLNPSTNAAGVVCSFRIGIMISAVPYPQ